MPWLFKIDWASLFTPELSIAELLVRGVVMYAIVFVLLRLVLRRQVGGIGTSDILVLVLISEVAGQGCTVLRTRICLKQSTRSREKTQPLAPERPGQGQA